MASPNIRSVEYMPTDMEKLLNKIKVLKDCVSEQEVYDHQCQLLHSQLTDLKLFCEKLSEACGGMIDQMEDD